jgi:SAM-dependent methyltransferase
LDRKAKDAGLGNITTVNASMFDMNFADQSFDLIWSEGAIYIIGFAKGLCEWKRFLKPSGLMAVSHISWLQDDIPPEPKAYWEKDYPEIATIRRNCDTVAAQGYYLLDQFTLPATAWDEYYNPKQTRLDMLTAKYADDPGVMQQVKDAQYGIDLYRKYAQFFGYVFYVVRKL